MRPTSPQHLMVENLVKRAIYIDEEHSHQMEIEIFFIVIHI